MEKEKALNLLGLAMRAGQLEHGDNQVMKAIQSNKTYQLIVARDASENTLKKYRNKSEYYKIDLTTLFSQSEISQAIGKNRTILAIVDQGFAQSFREKLH